MYDERMRGIYHTCVFWESEPKIQKVTDHCFRVSAFLAILQAVVWGLAGKPTNN